MNSEKYDSTQDTKMHIETIRGFLGEVQENVSARMLIHDGSKLEEPEKSMYDEFTPKLKDSTYGSDEYKSFLANMGTALQHHYQVNSHHPEHYKMFQCPVCETVFRENESPVSSVLVGEIRICQKCSPTGALIMECALEPASGIYGMSLLDLIEMLADWKAATARHADGDILKSIEINKKRFEIPDQLVGIFLNTLRELNW